MADINLIVPFAYNLAVPNDHAADRRCPGHFRGNVSQFDRPAHVPQIFVGWRGHLSILDFERGLPNHRPKSTSIPSPITLTTRP
jgi:hypothetical protein